MEIKQILKEVLEGKIKITNKTVSAEILGVFTKVCYAIYLDSYDTPIKYYVFPDTILPSYISFIDNARDYDNVDLFIDCWDKIDVSDTE